MTTLIRRASVRTRAWMPILPRSIALRMIDRRAYRALIAALATLLLVLILVLNPGAARVYASNMLGSARAPGEMAFIAGHRGDRSNAPENTMPAFRAAITGPVEVIETDIQLTKDNVPVMLHDATVDRTTDGHGKVGDLTLAQIKKLDAGSWFAASYAGTRVPTLDEFLAEFSHAKKNAMLELKGSWTSAEIRPVVNSIYRFGVQNRVMIESFNPGSLRRFAAIAPPIPTLIIAPDLSDDPVKLVKSVGAIALLTCVSCARSYPELVDKLHKAGIRLVLYTLDSKEMWTAALGIGADGIITDNPRKLQRWINERGCEDKQKIGISGQRR